MKVTVGLEFSTIFQETPDTTDKEKDQPTQGRLQFPSVASIAIHSQARSGSGSRVRWRARLRSTPIDYNRGGQWECKCGEGKWSVPTFKEGNYQSTWRRKASKRGLKRPNESRKQEARPGPGGRGEVEKRESRGRHKARNEEPELMCGGAVAPKKTGSGGIRRVPVNFSA